MVQYSAVLRLLRTMVVLGGSQWQSRFSCFDAANPFARSGLRVLDDTHIVRSLVNGLSKAFHMLWLLGKLTRKTWPRQCISWRCRTKDCRKTQSKIPPVSPVGCNAVLQSCAEKIAVISVAYLSSFPVKNPKEWTATTGVPAKYPLFFELLGLNIEGKSDMATIATN